MAKAKQEVTRADKAPVEVVNEVILKQSSEVKASPEVYDPAAWGQANLTSRDVIIPRILLMQPMSPQVTEGKVAFGEFVESLNESVLGKFDKGFDVVPFYMQKVFVEYKLEPPKKPGEKPEKTWFRTISITPENENLKYEDEVPDPHTGEIIQVTRDRVMNFYVLLKEELELGGAIPYILSFRKTSMTAGKKMTTQMYMKNINAGKNPASMIMHVFAKKESKTINGTNATWAVMDVKPVGLTPDKMIGDAFRWLQIIKEGNAKVHEDSYAAEGPAQEVGEATGGTGKF